LKSAHKNATWRAFCFGAVVAIVSLWNKKPREDALELTLVSYLL